MIFNLFFNSEFESLVNKLEIAEYCAAINVDELNAIRDYSKKVLKETPEASATRAFRELIVLNARIPVEKRVELCLKKRHTLKVWHVMDGKVNIDLYFSVLDSIEQLVHQYAGQQYTNDYFNQLINFGVVVPIKHDQLQFLSMVYLHKGKQSNLPPTDSAYNFFTNIIIQDMDKYPSEITKQGRGELRLLAEKINLNM